MTSDVYKVVAVGSMSGCAIQQVLQRIDPLVTPGVRRVCPSFIEMTS